MPEPMDLDTEEGLVIEERLDERPDTEERMEAEEGEMIEIEDTEESHYTDGSQYTEESQDTEGRIEAEERAIVESEENEARMGMGERLFPNLRPLSKEHRTRLQDVLKFYQEHLMGYPTKVHGEDRVFFNNDFVVVYVPDDGYIPLAKASSDEKICQNAQTEGSSLEVYVTSRVLFIFQNTYSLIGFAKIISAHPAAERSPRLHLELQIFHPIEFPKASDMIPYEQVKYFDWHGFTEGAQPELGKWMSGLKALSPFLPLSIRLIMVVPFRNLPVLHTETEELRTPRVKELLVFMDYSTWRQVPDAHLLMAMAKKAMTSPGLDDEQRRMIKEFKLPERSAMVYHGTRLMDAIERPPGVP